MDPGGTRCLRGGDRRGHCRGDPRARRGSRAITPTIGAPSPPPTYACTMSRVAIAILYHWWSAEKGSHGKVHLEPLKRLDGVINGLRAGLRYNPETGRSTAFAHGCDDFYHDGQPPDILREVAFAEAVCQEVEHAKRTDVVDKPNTLRTRFNEQYDHTILCSSNARVTTWCWMSSPVPDTTLAAPRGG